MHLFNICKQILFYSKRLSLTIYLIIEGVYCNGKMAGDAEYQRSAC